VQRYRKEKNNANRLTENAVSLTQKQKISENAFFADRKPVFAVPKTKLSE
jgi:hypothetical protein